ncbi:hypothetical protein ADIAL_0048 [Alkalibacterium sp. AK22]|uniref:DUF4153 domain-containing protein n=1 Tax=Alkalibacterium sp. AK22 TaxID=1229520 RepID=UPI00044DA844|nr:DUF4153 domain-containing protein [Alkalibacterium sp. AK22]EXJ24482.1 hypothetical protein ADIAL_0048 [Alkalibacterium sp. AK22]
MKNSQLFFRLKKQGSVVFKRFPLPIAFIGLATLFSLLSIQSNDFEYGAEVLASGLAALFLAALILFSEQLLSSKKWHWILETGLLLFILLYYIYLRQVDLSLNQAGSIRTLVFYFLGTVCLIAAPTVRSHISLTDTLTVMIKAFFSSLLLAVVMYLGVSAVLGTYSTLFAVLEFTWFSYSAALIFTFFAPVYFLSMIPRFNKSTEHKDIQQAMSRPKLLAILLDFIVVPLILVFTVLLLAYIGLNLTGEFWLDNLIEPMLISYVIIGLLTLFLTEPSEKQWVHLFTRYFPYLLLLIALFQSVSSSIKSFQLGLTYGRYFVLLFGLFAISSSLIFAFFKPKQTLIPLILILLGGISVLPYIDAVSIGISSQLGRVDHIVSENDLDENGRINSVVSFTDSEKTQLSYSFNHLQDVNALNRISWLPENFNYYNDFESIFGFDPFFFENTESPQEPVDRDYAYVEIDRRSPVVIPVNQADEAVFLSTYYLDTEDIYTLELNRESTELAITLEENLFVLELVEEGNLLLSFDLSFLAEDVFTLSENGETLSIEEATFTDENEAAEIRVILNYFEAQDTGVLNGDLTVLINYK